MRPKGRNVLLCDSGYLFLTAGFFEDKFWMAAILSNGMFTYHSELAIPVSHKHEFINITCLPS